MCSIKACWVVLRGVVNEYLRRIIEDNPSIREIIIAEDNKDMHDDPYLDLDTCGQIHETRTLILHIWADTT
jgi:hypothetical protein